MSPRLITRRPSTGPPKWAPTWVGIVGGIVWLGGAALTVAESGMNRTLEPALYFFAGLAGVGTIGGAWMHRTSSRYPATTIYTAEDEALG